MLYKLLLVDLDGVVWRGREAIEPNIRVLKDLQKRGDVKIVYATNNSSRTRLEYMLRLKHFGLEASIDDIITSSLIVAQYLKDQGGGTAFVVGEYGLISELVLAGINVLADAPKVDYVVVGIDRYLTYNKLTRAIRYIVNGAKFIVTNCDATLPTEEGIAPGAGAIMAAIITATGKKPDFIGGKPNPWIIDYVIRRYGVDKKEILVIGDRLDTDIQLGLNTGVDTLLVLTGVTKRNDPLIDKYKPTFIVETLEEARRRGII